MKIIGSISLLLFAALTAVVAAQTPPAGQALSADLGRYYFASPSAEVASRADLDSALEHLETFNGRINTGARLFDALQSYEAVLKLYRRHDGYLRLRCSLNRKDVACDENEKLGSGVSARTSFLNPEILAIPKERLHAFMIASPQLKTYEFAIADIRREAEHVLLGPEQGLLDRFHPEIAAWQYDLYEQVLAGIPFGTVQTSAGPLDVTRQRNLLASDPDPRVREEAFKRRYNGYASQRDALAFALIHTVRAQDSLATAHRYPDAPSSKYSSMYLDPVQTRALLTLMAQHGEIVKRFEKIRADDFQRGYGTPMQAWDLAAPHAGLVLPVTPLADAGRIFHDAFAGLGAEYQEAFDALLNPANGRADILPGGAPNRYTAGFSIGFTGSASMLFFGRYDGTFKDLSVIAHEGGHATHRGLMTAHDVKPLYAQGPSFLFESFAIFNELVLADYLSEHAVDPCLQRFYREQWMRIKGLDAFYGAQDALLEQQIYEGVSAGRVTGADDLDKLTQQVDGQFSIFPATTPELRNRWATVSLMYEDPLYDVNYVYGGLLALKYYQLYSSNGAEFIPRYIALLKNGFDAPPATLLKRFLNIDMFSPSLLTDDLDLLNARLNQLETTR
ncbi:MAG: M3 family metallopeptidase [Terriglobales bacterium]